MPSPAMLRIGLYGNNRLNIDLSRMNLTQSGLRSISNIEIGPATGRFHACDARGHIQQILNGDRFLFLVEIGTGRKMKVIRRRFADSMSLAEWRSAGDLKEAFAERGPPFALRAPQIVSRSGNDASISATSLQPRSFR